jgi:AraC-like DNA-binding protein
LPATAAVPADGLDVLSDVLRCVRLTGSMLFLVDASTPWVTRAPAASVFASAVLPRSQHLISYHVITEGACWGGLDGQAAQALLAGDILVIPHGAPYFLAAPAEARAPFDEAGAIDFFRRMAAGEIPPLVAEGGGGPDATRFICGFLGCEARPFNPVLAALPEVMVLRHDEAAAGRLQPLIDFALRELLDHRSGRREVLLRLSELMFVEAVRAHLEALPAAASGWFAGLRDPLVARALALLHGQPAERWTLDRLAARIGTSRSVLAERFHRRLGQPPMHYLAGWRLQLATRLLAEPAARVKAVAEAVGYDSESAFSRAFKRALGRAPADWRREEMR